MNLYDVINLKCLPSGDYRFTVTQRTSLGLNYYHGFRLMVDGRLLSPSVPAGGKLYKAIVELPVAALAAIRKKALTQIVKFNHAEPYKEVINERTDSAIAHEQKSCATTTPPDRGQ